MSQTALLRLPQLQLSEPAVLQRAAAEADSSAANLAFEKQVPPSGIVLEDDIRLL